MPVALGVAVVARRASVKMAEAPAALAAALAAAVAAMAVATSAASGRRRQSTP